MLFTKKYPKKENNKFPLRINYTSENLSNALEGESLKDFNEEKENENRDKIEENNFTSKRNTKTYGKINFYNSFNYDKKDNDNIKIKNKNIYEIKHNVKNNKNMTQENKNKKLINTERINSINSNEINRNKSLNRTKRNNMIQKNYNLYFSGDKNDIDSQSLNIMGSKKERKEVKIQNNIPKNYNFITNHDSLSFNPIKTEKNNNHILKIKNNERLMIASNSNHNKVNSMGDDTFIDKKRDRTYKISSHVVNEQFYKDNFAERELSSSDDENILQMSMQSLNDSKIMEIANRYITDEENLDRNEILEILNSKKEKN